MKANVHGAYIVRAAESRPRTPEPDQAGRYVDRRLDELRTAYVAGELGVEAYERRVERVLAGAVHEPSEEDKALVAALFKAKGYA